jgi:hypothetical protein
MTEMELETTDLDIGVRPDRPDAGGPMQIKVTLKGDLAADTDGLMAVLKDADGEDLATAPIAVDPADGAARAVLGVTAPDSVGDVRWDLRVTRADDTLASAGVSFSVAPTVIRPSVWNLPTAITAGETFRFTVGLADASSRSAANRAFVVEDQDGAVLHSDTTGPIPVPGTNGLHCAEVELRAPTRAGRHLWRVRPADAGPDRAEAPAPADIHLNVVGSPDRVIKILALDAVSGQPVDRARVVAHPFRTHTNAEGRAEIAVPAGSYTVFVSGLQYFAFKAEADLEKNATIEIRAEMHVDRAYDEVDQWA